MTTATQARPDYKALRDLFGELLARVHIFVELERHAADDELRGAEYQELMEPAARLFRADLAGLIQRAVQADLVEFDESWAGPPILSVALSEALGELQEGAAT